MQYCLSISDSSVFTVTIKDTFVALWVKHKWKKKEVALRVNCSIRTYTHINSFYGKAHMSKFCPWRIKRARGRGQEIKTANFGIMWESFYRKSKNDTRPPQDSLCVCNRVFHEHTELAILALLAWEALYMYVKKIGNKMLPPPLQVSIALGTFAIQVWCLSNWANLAHARIFKLYFVHAPLGSWI